MKALNFLIKIHQRHCVCLYYFRCLAAVIAMPSISVEDVLNWMRGRFDDVRGAVLLENVSEKQI